MNLRKLISAGSPPIEFAGDIGRSDFVAGCTNAFGQLTFLIGESQGISAAIITVGELLQRRPSFIPPPIDQFGNYCTIVTGTRFAVIADQDYYRSNNADGRHDPEN